MPAFTEALGAGQVKPAKPVMGAEDFGLFNEGNVPICMFWLGTISPERIEAASSKGETLPALHSAKYYPDPGPSIATGVRAMTAAVVKLAQKTVAAWHGGPTLLVPEGAAFLTASET